MLDAVILGMFSDLGFYLSLAGTAAGLAGAGAGPLLLGWAVLSAAFALAWLLRGKGAARFAPFALAAAALVLARPGTAACAALLPGAGYALYMTAKRRWDPEPYRTAALFSLLWKGLLGITVLLLIAGKGEAAVTVTLPIGFTTLMALTLLNRSLRHAPEVRNTAAYRLTELALVLGAGGAAALLGSRRAVELLLTAARAVYTYVAAPLLYAMVWLFYLLIRGVAWLIALLPLSDAPLLEELPQMPEGFAEQELLSIPEDGGGNTILSVILRAMGAALLVLAVAAALFFLLRWLSRRSPARQDVRPAFRDRRSTVDAPERLSRRAMAREQGSAAAVRAAYRKYLKLCAAGGVSREPGDTSLDLLRRGAELFPQPEADELRTLYLRARYGESASREDAARARELLRQLRRRFLSASDRYE